MLYTSFLTQDWVKPALIYLKFQKIFKKKKRKITKKRKYSNLCQWRSLFRPVLCDGLRKMPPQGGDNTYQHSWMSAFFFLLHNLLFLCCTLMEMSCCVLNLMFILLYCPLPSCKFLLSTPLCLNTLSLTILFCISTLTGCRYACLPSWWRAVAAHSRSPVVPTLTKDF